MFFFSISSALKLKFCYYLKFAGVQICKSLKLKALVIMWLSTFQIKNILIKFTKFILIKERKINKTKVLNCINFGLFLI